MSFVQRDIKPGKLYVNRCTRTGDLSVVRGDDHGIVVLEDDTYFDFQEWLDEDNEVVCELDLKAIRQEASRMRGIHVVCDAQVWEWSLSAMRKFRVHGMREVGKDINALAQGLVVIVRWVRGHRGRADADAAMNTRADRLATMGLSASTEFAYHYFDDRREAA